MCGDSSQSLTDSVYSSAADLTNPEGIQGTGLEQEVWKTVNNSAFKYFYTFPIYQLFPSDQTNML